VYVFAGDLAALTRFLTAQVQVVYILARENRAIQSQLMDDLSVEDVVLHLGHKRKKIYVRKPPGPAMGDATLSYVLAIGPPLKGERSFT
jgi:hypothetical protein